MIQDVISLVADIGGTNTRVALAYGTHVDPKSIKRYRNAEHPDGIEPILKDYLSGTDIRPVAACIDMAGPVKDGVGELTNLDWTVVDSNVAEATGAGLVSLLNDMQAQGIAVAYADEDNVHSVVKGAAGDHDDTRLVVNVGTGLNAAPVYRKNGQTMVPPAESGHITLPVQTEEELRLKNWIVEKTGETPGLEDVLSGRGFERIYAWLCDENGAGVPLKAPEIMGKAEIGDPTAMKAVRMFVHFMGRYSGNLALITVPLGGVYLVGGVARHFLPYLEEHGFADAFRDKGRFADYMDQFPVYLVSDDYAALSGCAAHITERLAQ